MRWTAENRQWTGLEPLEARVLLSAVAAGLDDGPALVAAAADPDLAWSSFLGGTGSDKANGIAIAPDGSARIVGWTDSTDINGATNANAGGFDAFIARVTAAGALAWVTYIGGSENDLGNEVVVDEAGNAYIVGDTRSSDLPANTNNHQGGFDAFVTKVDGNGNITWSTYLGGSGLDNGFDIALNGTAVAVAGVTESTNLQGAGNTSHGGFNDAFVARLDMTTGNAAWTRYLGGGDEDRALGVAFDSAGDVWATGGTMSDDFTGAVNTYKGGESDIFVAQLAGASGAVVQSRYHGGTFSDTAFAIAIDDADQPHLTGTTDSVNFVGAVNAFLGGSSDAFALKLNADGSVNAMRYLGGTGDELGSDIVIDAAGGALITGETGSMDFEAAGNSYFGDARDLFIAGVNAALDIGFVKYLGGTLRESFGGVAVDHAGGIWAAGATTSPAFIGANNTFKGGTQDGVVAKIAGPTLIELQLLGAYRDDVATDTFEPGDEVEIRVRVANTGAAADIIASLAAHSPDFDISDPTASVIYDSHAAAQDINANVALGGIIELSFTFTLADDAPDGLYRIFAAARPQPFVEDDVFDTTGPLAADDDRTEAAYLVAFNIGGDPLNTAAPEVSVDTPAADTAVVLPGMFDIMWTATDIDANPVSVSLFYDSDDVEGDETLIVGGLDASGAFSWDVPDALLGQAVFIKAVADDGDFTAFDYSAGRVLVSGPDDVAFEEDFETGIDGWSISGDAQLVDDGTGNMVIQLTEQPAPPPGGAPPDATIYRDFDLAEDVGQLLFDFHFTQLGDGDALVVSIDGQPAWSFIGTDYTGDPLSAGGPVDVSAFAGQQVEIEFRLSTTNAVNSQAWLDNIQIAPAPGSPEDPEDPGEPEDPQGPGDDGPLVVEHLLYAAGRYAAGDALTVAAVVRNTGDTAADAQTLVRAVLTTDATIGNGDDIMIDTIALGSAVAPGMTGHVVLSGDVQAGAVAGDYFVAVVIETGDADDPYAIGGSADVTIVPAGQVGDTRIAIGNKDKAEYVDPDGNEITIDLKGDGTGVVMLAADGTMRGIVITGATAKSQIKVKVNGDSLAGLGPIIVSGALKAAQGKGAALVGGIFVTDTLDKVQFDRVDGHAIIAVAGEGDKQSSYKFDIVTNLTILSRTAIKSIGVTTWTDDDATRDVVETPWMKNVKSKENFAADLLLYDDTQSTTLGKLSVGRWLDDVILRIAGHVKGVQAGAIRDSDIFIGVKASVVNLPDDADDFDMPAELKKLAVKGLSDVAGPSYINTRIAAWSLGKASLKEVETANTAIPHGLAALALKSFSRDAPDGAVKLKKLETPGTVDDEDDFRVTLLSPA